MAETGPEPFHVALGSLRDRLRDGAYRPGARIAATDLADELRLSTTPVREALSRLAGEGLLEDRRGQGYFVRLPNALDIADLYRISLAHLLIAQEPHRPLRRPVGAPIEPATPEGAVRRIDRLLVEWVAESGSRALLSAFRLNQVQLGVVRQHEGEVIPDLDDEAQRLVILESADRATRLVNLRQFHGRRIRLAEALGALLARTGDA
ncbi:GntR family transcriptional regulator [Phenylobacterium sp.]|uniref:GntR family transcriptional regulator n=1 Tax=Phenylobacterium sp. TaxID=1871053 RepID=UPI003564515A